MKPADVGTVVLLVLVIVVVVVDVTNVVVPLVTVAEPVMLVVVLKGASDSSVGSCYCSGKGTVDVVVDTGLVAVLTGVETARMRITAGDSVIVDVVVGIGFFA